MKVKSIFPALSLLVLVSLGGVPSGARSTEEEVIFTSPFTEEQRLKGFYNYRKNQEAFERYRVSGVSEVKRQQMLWDEMIRKTLPEYKKEKSKVAAPLDESSPAYHRDIGKRLEFFDDLEEARRRYIRERNAAELRRKTNVKLSEEEEYGLLALEDRVDYRKRALYAGKLNSKSSGGGSSGGGSSSGGIFDAPVPPPPPPPTDYFEPEMPPPPPPLDGGGFDDTIPPPMFEDPEF